MAVNEFDENTGTVGVRLMFKNNLVQHCGFKLVKGLPSHLLYKQPCPKKYDGKVVATFGNTGAFMLTSKELWDKIGGLNEKYERCFEDVEYNFSCLSNGKRNKTHCGAVCWHYESATRKNAPLMSDVKKLLGFYKELVSKHLEKNKKD